MIIIAQTDQSTVYLDNYMGRPVRFRKCKKTGEVTIFSDDVATILGFANTVEMLSDDGVMDRVIQIQKETGSFPIRRFED
ncbi:hypothetical protein [Dyadobacter crusticola]|uniref:hypothetical protein n=1 Tax=Dyadobacter crusticola TaxID=292407 RepID=UPI0004E193B9|nr:hypothetical protein [Dyadobacter crusticola]